MAANATNVSENITHPENIKNLGLFLAENRQKNNFSQEDIANKLNLRLSIIKHIESDEQHLIKLPKAYISGYIKNYFKLLGLKLDDYASYEEQIRVFPTSAKVNSYPEPTQQTQQAPSQKNIMFFLGALAICALLFSLFFLSQSDSESEPETTQIEQSNNE